MHHRLPYRATPKRQFRLLQFIGHVMLITAHKGEREKECKPNRLNRRARLRCRFERFRRATGCVQSPSMPRGRLKAAGFGNIGETRRGFLEKMRGLGARVMANLLSDGPILRCQSIAAFRYVAVDKAVNIVRIRRDIDVQALLRQSSPRLCLRVWLGQGGVGCWTEVDCTAVTFQHAFDSRRFWRLRLQVRQKAEE